MSSHHTYKSSLLFGLIVAFIFCQEVPNRLPPAEVFCLDSYCNRRISQARALKDLFSGGELFISKDTVVDVVAKSAVSEDSRLKIMYAGQAAYVDSTLVTDLGSSEPSGLKRFINHEAKVSLDNRTPDMASPSPAESASAPVKTEPATEKKHSSAEDTPKHTLENVHDTKRAKFSSNASDSTVIAGNLHNPLPAFESNTSASQLKRDVNPKPVTPDHPVAQQSDSDVASVKPFEMVKDTMHTAHSPQHDEPILHQGTPKATNVTEIEMESTISKDNASQTAGTNVPSINSNTENALAVELKDNRTGSDVSTPPDERNSSNVTVADPNSPSYSETNNTHSAVVDSVPPMDFHNETAFSHNVLSDKIMKEEKQIAKNQIDSPALTQPLKLIESNSSHSPLSTERHAGSASEELSDTDTKANISGLPSLKKTAEQSFPTIQPVDLKTSGTEKSTDFVDPVSTKVLTDPLPSEDNGQSLSKQVGKELPVSELEQTDKNTAAPSDTSKWTTIPTGVDISPQSDLLATSVSDVPSLPRPVLSDHINQDQPQTSTKQVSESNCDSIFECQTVESVHPSFLRCIAWAVNETRNSPNVSSSSMWSPLSILMRHLLHITEHFLSSYVPDPIRYIAEQTTTQFLLLPFDAVIVLLFLSITFILFGCLVVKSIIFSLFGLHGSEGLNSIEYSKAEEEISQLSSRLSDQEKVNSQLTDWANKLNSRLQHVQTKHNEEVADLQQLIDASKTELYSVNEKLVESVKKCAQLKQLEGQLSEKENYVTRLDADIKKFQEERCALEQDWEAKFADMKEMHKKAMDDAKQEQEDLYHQAIDYYNRMKAMQPEMDKLIEARKQAEEKVASLETELNSLRTTFTTLKSFELALEQETVLAKQKSTTSVEQSDYMLVEGSVESDTESIKHEEDGCKLESEIKSSPSGSGVIADTEAECENEQQESKLRANLALFLDVGRLQAELTAAQNQIKSQEARAHCEHELRLKLEEKIEQIERENSDLRTECSQAKEEKTAAQTRLEVLSAYFKEREVELQKDLGKHVVVGSESTEALSTFRKRNKELEVELKTLRDQLTSLRRELGETERVNRRQISELDKKSHENWLSARAADHQVRELRDENNLLRQKLLEAERAILPPALRTQQVNPARIPFPLGKLPSGVAPRPLLRNPPSINSGRLEKRSLSGHSLTSLSSQTSVSRPDLPNLPFPLPPPPPPPPHLMSLPRTMPLNGSQPPIPPFIPGISPNRIPLPPGFPPPPPPPPPPLMLNNQHVQMSPASSVAGSLSRPVT